MTILPKKKQSKSEDENEPNDDCYNYWQMIPSSSNATPPTPLRNQWSNNDVKRTHPDHQERSNKRRHRHRESGSELHSLSPNHSPRSAIPNYEDFALPCSSRMDFVQRESQISPAEEEPEKECNSGDEYDKPEEHWTTNDWEQKERQFERMLKKKGFIIRKMGEDGACFFRSVADQIYGDQEMHSVVRKLCLDYMEKNSDFFSQFVTENFSSYISRKRHENSHGNNLEMQAVSEIYNRPIEIYHYSSEPINTFQGCLRTENEPIRLAYHKKVHYDSIVNPHKPTVGVGLGLPGFQPGSVEKNIIDRAKLMSEQSELEQAMLEDKLRATDWDATGKAIEQQVVRESYMEWLKQQRANREAGEGSSKSGRHSKSSSPNYPPKQSTPPPQCSRSTMSPPRSVSSAISTTASTSSTKRKSPEPQAHFFSDWIGSEDDMARILAQSQAEYLDSLKLNASSTSSTNDFNGLESSSTSTTSPSTSASTSNVPETFYLLPSTSHSRSQ